ncbi:hypothetical protein [Chitinivibrio alkaliphilus]|uniref:Uncharacterized protein n=1 Tax=Chitinivibrio alkaliphilus ACht1 TaxID=1313304 RepID=U7D7S2_9BACT|nr:hypothetical protein [Chitinivibrio alkaliphilus]ERP31142.1 hypothetical protein CALK_1940 [Chitinivibrio alkaliphilus ACht1]
MRISIKIIAGMLIVATALSASQVFYVRPVRSTGIYENRVREVNERALEQVDESDRLLVRQTQGRYYFVEYQGIEGWVEQSNVARTEGRAFTFDNITVQGYMDNPTALHIADQRADLTSPVDIDRSFEEALKKGTDKESVLRQRY